MYRFAYYLTFDKDEAKDLVQETFLKAYRFLKSFQQGINAKAWLHRILKNSFITDYRKKSKQPIKIDYQEVDNFYNSHAVNSDLTVDFRVDVFKDMVGDEVTMTVNSLAVNFRMVVIFCYLESFTYEEVSKLLNIPIGTVRSRLHRVRNLLRKKLASYATAMGFN